jgi:hypothetical protein
MCHEISYSNLISGPAAPAVDPGKLFKAGRKQERPDDRFSTGHFGAGTEKRWRAEAI